MQAGLWIERRGVQVMTDREDEARAYFAAHADRRELVICAEALRLGRADVLFAGSAGVLMHLHNTKNYLVAALDTASAQQVLAALPGRCVETSFATASDDDTSSSTSGNTGDHETRVLMFSDVRIARDLGFDDEHCEPYYFYIYDQPEPVQLSGNLTIRQLTVADFSTVASHYAMLSDAEIRRHLLDGWIWGGFDSQGELIGFIGEHDEASMGMLEVFPAYRRRGYARELQGAAINRLRAAGRVPYGQVALDNEASQALQRSIGMTRISTVHAWCWETC